MSHRPKKTASAAQGPHFWAAVGAGNARRLQALLSQIGETAFGRLAAQRAENGETALMLAAAPDHALWAQANGSESADALRTLPDGRCAIDILLPFSDPLALCAGKDALAHALDNRNESAVRSLIPVSNLDLKAPDGHGDSPGVLARALRGDSYEIAALVIAALAPERLGEADQNGDTPLMLSAGSGLDTLPLLLKHNDVRARNHSGETAFMFAAARGDTESLKALAPLSDFSARDHEGRDALMHAAENGAYHSIEFLLSSPFFDPQALKARDARGFTALMLTARGDFCWCVSQLLPGSDPAVADANGDCAFSMALLNEDGHAAADEMAQFVNPDSTAPDGRTFLRMAIDARAWTTANALFPRASDASVEDAFRGLSAALLGEASAARAEAFFLARALQLASAAQSGRHGGSPHASCHAENGNGLVDSEQAGPTRPNARSPRL